MAVRLARSPEERARQEAAAVLAQVPEELRPGPSKTRRHAGWPIRAACSVCVTQRYRGWSPFRPARHRCGCSPISRLNCWAASRPPSTGWRYSLPIPPGRLPAVAGVRRLRIQDWLPPFVNAGRTFVAIGAAELFWIVTAWPNGAAAITFATIVVILFAPRADQAYTTAIGFLIGSILTVAIAATIKFGVLPKVEAFVGFSFKKFWRSLLFRSARSGHRTIWARLRYSSLSTIAPMLPG